MWPTPVVALFSVLAGGPLMVSVSGPALPTVLAAEPWLGAGAKTDHARRDAAEGTGLEMKLGPAQTASSGRVDTLGPPRAFATLPDKAPHILTVTNAGAAARCPWRTEGPLAKVAPNSLWKSPEPEARAGSDAEQARESSNHPRWTIIAV